MNIGQDAGVDFLDLGRAGAATGAFAFLILILIRSSNRFLTWRISFARIRILSPFISLNKYSTCGKQAI
jgi:hypothetical protein